MEDIEADIFHGIYEALAHTHPGGNWRDSEGRPVLGDLDRGDAHQALREAGVHLMEDG